HHAVFTAYQGGSMRSYLAGQGYHLERYSSQIGARIASLEEARRLRLSKKAPVLTVATISHDQQGEVFELAYSVSRSDSFQYKIVLKEK
ncbi:MAG TPA: UTRA domain-containing protein, partial [Oligella sp.]|nr:UTRA domain-containing protein [Oligella sp.]